MSRILTDVQSACGYYDDANKLHANYIALHRKMKRRTIAYK